MAQVIAKCRLTGHYKYISTSVSAGEFPLLPEIFAREFCPFCACEHGWHKRDAILLDAKKPPRQAVQQTA
jgi:hypothetical protein